MKNYAKVGNRKGKPAYRTPSGFRYRTHLKAVKLKNNRLKNMRILVFGDSISYGAWDLEGGWVARLRKFLDRKVLESGFEFYYLIYNLGISGDTSEDLSERFEFETRQRLKEKETTIIIFAVGGNDSGFSQGLNSLRISPERFQDNLGYLISFAQKYSSDVIFLGLAPVDESKTTPISWNADVYYKNEYIANYNEIIKSVCKKNKVYFIDIFDTLKNLDYENLLEDGAHPNADGHQKIFEIVKDFLLENEII